MTGKVDEDGRALVLLRLWADAASPPSELEAWIDTAFTGELVIPRATIQRLRLSKSAEVPAVLADGTIIFVDTFSCFIRWFGEDRRVEVVESDAQLPLLGIGLLRDRRLVVDYRALTVTLE